MPLYIPKDAGILKINFNPKNMKYRITFSRVGNSNAQTIIKASDEQTARDLFHKSFDKKKYAIITVERLPGTFTASDSEKIK